jgi:hypothetical protein
VKERFEDEIRADVPTTEATSRPVLTSGAIRNGNVSTRRTAVAEIELPSVTRSASFDDELSPPSTYLEIHQINKIRPHALK